MPDISQIEVNGTIYDICDATVREKDEYASANATKVGSYWESGNIIFHRKGNIVQVTASPKFTAIDGRQTVATIPEGFRPISTAYVTPNGATDGRYYMFTSSGNVQNGATMTARTDYFSGTWVVGA